jgi:hypothetical protein
MAKQRVKFTYEKALVTKPVIFELGRQFNVVTNIRRADVRDDMGWVVLELEGDQEDISQGLQWVKAQGVRVDPVAGDVVEG